MNPTGVMRETDRDMALKFLSTSDSQQTYEAAVDQLLTQIKRERAAVQSFRGAAPEAAPPPAARKPEVGEVRVNKNGVRGKWNGTGWEVID